MDAGLYLDIEWMWRPKQVSWELLASRNTPWMSTSHVPTCSSAS